MDGREKCKVRSLAARPRVKPEHTPYRTAKGHIRLGGGLFGIAAEVKDPTGWIWGLLQAMDGSRSVEDVIEVMCRPGSRSTPSEVVNAIEALFQAGHLEDASTLEPASLSPGERERYSRSHAFFRWVDSLPRMDSWHVQMRLHAARVVVVGVGGAGGAAAQALAATGVGHLHCVDSDVVELSNLNRQTLYDENDIGRPKVDAAVAKLSRLNSDITVTGKSRDICGQGDLDALAAGCDVLVLGADRPPSIRDWANRACLAAGVPWVDGGYHGALITVGMYRPGDGGCRECLRRAEERRLDMSAFAPEDRPFLGPRAPGHPVVAASAGITGHLMAHAAISLLTGVPDLPAGRLYGMNLITPDDPVLLCHPRDPNCPACGHRK